MMQSSNKKFTVHIWNQEYIILNPPLTFADILHSYSSRISLHLTVLVRYYNEALWIRPEGSGCSVLQPHSQVKDVSCSTDVCYYAAKAGYQQSPSSAVSCQNGTNGSILYCRKISWGILNFAICLYDCQIIHIIIMTLYSDKLNSTTISGPTVQKILLWDWRKISSTNFLVYHGRTHSEVQLAMHMHE